MPVPWYDDWKLNPPEPKTMFCCEVCDYEIAKGDSYYLLDDGSKICTSEYCLLQKAKELLAPKEELA